MINLDALRKEETGLRELRDQLRQSVVTDRANGDRSREENQAQQIGEINARLAVIADELRGPCIVV